MSTSIHSHYPGYDVMEQADHWDEHTQQVVGSRLIKERPYSVLTVLEAETLRAWCSRLVDDERAEVIQFTLSHIDENLSSAVGEGQRKAGIPSADKLLRTGLRALDSACQSLYTQRFFELDDERQLKMMTAVSSDQADPPAIWAGVPQKALFQKLLTLTLEAYYSHPRVWSEIGYAGPAYPRGYIRTRPDQHDSWEATRSDES
jgi:hypothetical protein